MKRCDTCERYRDSSALRYAGSDAFVCVDVADCQRWAEDLAQKNESEAAPVAPSRPWVSEKRLCPSTGMLELHEGFADDVRCTWCERRRLMLEQEAREKRERAPVKKQRQAHRDENDWSPLDELEHHRRRGDGLGPIARAKRY